MLLLNRHRTGVSIKSLTGIYRYTKESSSSSSSSINRSITAFTEQPFNGTTLAQRVDSYILNSDEVVSKATVKAALDACGKLARESSLDVKRSPYISSQTARALKFKNAEPKQSQLAINILGSKATILDNDILRHFFLLKPPPDTQDCVEAMRLFHHKNHNKIPIDLDIAYIPFRRALLKEEIERAFQIVDYSAASKPYIRYLKIRYAKIAGMWGIGCGGIMSIVQVLLNSGIFGIIENTAAIQLMMAVSLGNLSIFTVLVLASRVGDNGGRLKFIPGVLQHYWLLHGHEKQMINDIADTDEMIPENHGEVSTYVKVQSQRRHLAVGDSQQEMLLKEYWARAGEGFEWVEPDQDPADAEIRKKKRSLLTDSTNTDNNNNSNNDNATSSLSHLIADTINNAKHPSKGLPN